MPEIEIILSPVEVEVEVYAAAGVAGPTGATGPAGADGADGVDGVGVPPGGTTGQVLAKASNADHDTAWVDQTGGGGGAVDSVNGQTGVVVLTAADVGADASGTAAAAVSAHVAASDPHPGYRLESAAVPWTDLSGVPSTFPPSTHSHAWGDLTGAPTWDGTTIGVGRVQLDTAASAPVSPAAGLLWWDAADKTVAMSTDIAGTALQLGQEQWIRAVNKTGSTITDGSVVYISGAQGNRPTIAKADADLASAEQTIGVVTADIANNAEGFVCIQGIVRGFNTSGFAAGDSLYLSQTAGAIVNVVPAKPVHAVRIGWALNSTNNGSILVSVHVGSDLAGLHDVSTTTPSAGQVISFDGSVWVNAADKAAYRQVLHGTANRDSLTIGYNAGSRLLTVTGTPEIYKVGVPTTTPLTFAAHANVTGGYFFMIDAANAAVVRTTPWDLYTEIPVSYIYYNATLGDALVFYELHEAWRDPSWHKRTHEVDGTQVIPGGHAISGYTLNSDTDAAKTVAIASGTVADEDIRVTTSAVVDGGPYLVMRRTGAAGEWTWTRTATVPFLHNGTDIQWNEFTGSTWQLTALASTSFVNIWVFVFPTIGTQQVCFIVGQAQHSTQAAAEAEAVSSLSFGTVSFQEIAPIYQLTYRRAPSNGNTGKADLRRVARLGGGRTTVMGTAATPTTAAAVAFVPAGNIAATNVQTALEELDTEKAAATHATQHQNGGADEIATATAGANAIPKAGAGGTLAATWLPAMVGDSGSGGTKGAVPAPAAGDASAGKVLKADGTWGTVSASTVTLTQPSQYTTSQTVTWNHATAEQQAIDVDFNGTSLTCTLATSNRAANKHAVMRIRNSHASSALTIAYPSGPAWVALGFALPTTLAAGKALVINLSSFGTTNGDICCQGSTSA